jgi:hypothetical protein
MALRSLFSALCLLLALAATQAMRTAVVLESPELQKTHSKFFKLLEGLFKEQRNHSPSPSSIPDSLSSAPLTRSAWP